MARRPSLIKLKAKNQKKSKTEQYLVNRKYLGDEPVYTSKPIEHKKLFSIYSWYNYMCDIKEAKEYLLTYLKNVGRDQEAKAISDVPDKWIPTTAAWIARMRTQGAVLPESSKTFFEDRLLITLARDYSKKNEAEDSSEEDAPKAVAKPLTVQDRMKQQLEVLICELEEQIDDFTTKWQPGFMMYTWLQANEVPAVQAKRIHEFYNPQLLEIEDYVEGRLDEGYDGYSKDHLKKLFGFYVMIVEDIEQYLDNSKKVRKTRVAKPISMDKKLKDFKHLDFDNIRKIQSVQPQRIIGASELWTFNTKYNQLTVFKIAEQTNGLDVHRTAITGFDETQSLTKKLKAKDIESVLKEVQSCGKVALRNLMKTTRGSDQKLQIRMNENTILLRVVNK